VVGSHPSLGDWDQDLSQVELFTDDDSYPNWTAECDFTPGALLEFKFLVLGMGSKSRWEDAIVNRTLQVPEAGEACVTARFNCAEDAQDAGLAAMPSRPILDEASALAALTAAVRRAEVSESRLAMVKRRAQLAELAERQAEEAARRTQAAVLRRNAASCHAGSAERRAAKAEEQASAAEAVIADMRLALQLAVRCGEELKSKQCGSIPEFTEGRVEQTGSRQSSVGEIGVEASGKCFPEDESSTAASDNGENDLSTEQMRNASIAEVLTYCEQMRERLDVKDIHTILGDMDSDRDGKLSIDELLQGDQPYDAAEIPRAPHVVSEIRRRFYVVPGASTRASH